MPVYGVNGYLKFIPMYGYPESRAICWAYWDIMGLLYLGWSHRVVLAPLAPAW